MVTAPQGLAGAKGRRVRRRRGRNVASPANTVYVGRPTLWGNPFAGRCSGHAKSVILHRHWLAGDIGALMLEEMGFCPAQIDALARLRSRVLANLFRLAGKDLACWCPESSQWCHANNLLNLAASHAEWQAAA